MPREESKQGTRAGVNVDMDLEGMGLECPGDQKDPWKSRSPGCHPGGREGQ